jgi:phosphocarrier protein HPr
MYTRQVRLDNKTGFHVRPATLFMDAANRFRATVHVFTADRVADGKSAISLMLLEAQRGTELTIQGSGDDEVAAVEALVALVQRRFDEPPD